MRVDHVLKLNDELATTADIIGAAIKVREEEISVLRKAQSMLLTASEAEASLPSFVKSDDPGFQKVAAAADEAERRGARPVVTTQTDTREIKAA